jgi:hypothetical protein
MASPSGDCGIGHAVAFQRARDAQRVALAPWRRDDLDADRQLSGGAQRDRDDRQADKITSS